MSTGKDGIRNLLCLAFFQAGWFACVLSAAAGKPELGAVSILSWVTVCSAIGRPKVIRLLTRRHILSKARSARPIRRIQW